MTTFPRVKTTIYKSFIGVLTLMVGMSCGIDQTYRDTASVGFSDSLSSGGNPLNDGEMAVALRICYAFRSKRTKFLAEMLESPFNFQYEVKDCQGQETLNETLNTTLKQLMISGPMSFEASGVSFTYPREVQTDINGDLKNICNQMFKGETPLDVQEVDNEFLEYRFRSGIYDEVEIVAGSRPNPQAEVPLATRMVQYQVLTNQQSSGDYLGLVVKTSRFFPCETTSNLKTQVQTFIAP